MSCDNMKPYACGGSMNPNTVQNPCDRSLHFEGADDVTINQGVGIDLTEGVHAYDANGNEIEYTVEPDSIEKCEVGDHVITYTATGEGSRSVPTMCGETALYARACNIITEIKKRIITILQSANPIIRGLSDALIQPDETFSPLSGVTAEDANGNELTVSYSGRYTNTAEGEIATFDTPYAEPMVSLVADIDPIQDLHGYDRPWVGGGGKNKLDNSTVSSLSNVTYQNGVATEIEYDSRNRALFVLHAYNNGTHVRKLGSSYGNIKQLPFTKDSTFNKISFGNSGAEKDAKLMLDVSNLSDGEYKWCFTPENYTTHPFSWKDMMIVESSVTDYSYEPYTNICPISGWDSVDVSVAGKNLIDIEDGVIQTTQRNIGSVTIKAGTYTASGHLRRDDGGSCRIMVKVGDNPINTSTTVSGASGGVSAYTFTVEKTTVIEFGAQFLTDYDTMHYSQMQIELGTTATAYEPYQGHTYTTTLPQTVYGGTLDVVSGVLTVDRAMVDLGSLNWSYSSTSQKFATTIANKKVRYSADVGSKNVWCSALETVGAISSVGVTVPDCVIFELAQISGSNVVCATNSAYTDVASFKTAMTGQTMVYFLATPTTIQLTPTQIDSLLGRNNVWADSGDVTVEYVDEIPQSAFSYPVRGTYTITYTAEDECGNRTEKNRTIQVGEETFRTVIYEDKTLIINEKSSDMEENERLHGRAEYVYDAMDNDHPYVFSSPEDIPWHYFAGYPERVEFGSEVHPTSTAYWFYYMNQVNTFDFTNLDTSNVTDMKYMFYGCEHILNLAPELDTSNVTDMSHMFERCIATPEIDVSSFDTSNVTDMSSMFASCYNLHTIYAKPTFVTDNVTSSNLMFGYDAHLVGGMGTPYDSNYEDKTYARIDDIPQTKGYFTDKDHITEWFRTAIHYDGTLIINESSLDQATNRELHGDAVSVYPPLDADHDYVFYTTSGGGSPYDVYWYQNRNNIKSVKIGSPIKPTNTAFWFNACDKITEMDFTNMDTSDVTEIGWMFFGCSKLNEIEFGDSFDTGNVFNFVGMFQSCSELESVDLSGFDTSSATLIGSMFNSDSSLKTIYASDAFVTDNVTSSSDMFSGCTSLVGGSGTVYNQNKTDAEYARIDNQPDEPGYFTSK